MHAEDRSIHFSTELFHKPQTHQTQRLQKLYYELSQSGAGSYTNTDFNVPGQPRFYSRRGERSQSILVFLPDRFVLIEEWADMSLHEFLDKVWPVSRQVMLELDISSISMQTATLRSTCVLSHYKHAGAFLIDHACQQAGRIEPYFQRPIAVGGLRFVLPETSEHQGTLHVTIEPFRAAPSELFVEVKGVYRGEPMGVEELDRALDQIQYVRDFVTDSVYPYLEQYDTPPEEAY